MSKLFEALRKTEGAVAEIAMSVLGEQVALIPEAPPADQPAKVEHPPLETPVFEKRTEARTGMRIEPIRITPNSPMLPFDGSDPRAAEQYKIIRTKIRHHPGQPKMLLVSSPMPGDGKTISAANLAGALALEENLRVLLVDCDFRRASLTRLLGLDTGGPGLGEVLRGEATIESTLVSIAQFPNLYFLPQGGPSPSPSELLSSSKWHELTQLLRSEFAFTVLDAPPVGTVADYELLQLASDGVVLIARPDHTNRQLWRNALETVPKAKQLGVILNCVEDWFLWKTRGYYYYSENGR